MSYYDGGSFSGQSYDRHIFEANLSTVNKVQREYWTAKQVLKKKLGKVEDEHVVASDSEIDSKLSLFASIQKTCVQLLKELDKYQSAICALARDENHLGRFLKEQGSQDRTQAGKMMAAVGKSLCYSAQQRIVLRHPLSRLHQDIETFRYRAIADTIMSIDKMEEERTHYRASLLWMQDISSNLDPEQYKKLEKFRKVQKEVKINKEKFDRLKWAVCQKIDLLTASRSNLFSNTLVPYQDELLKFWEKTAHTMAAVLESFMGYQHYEFKLLKDLNPIQELDTLPNGKESDDSKEKEENNGNDDELITLDDKKIEEEQNEESPENLFQDAMDALDIKEEKEGTNAEEPNPENLLGDFESADASKEEIDLLEDILGNNEQQGTSDFENQWKSVFGDFESAPVQAGSLGDGVKQAEAFSLAQGATLASQSGEKTLHHSGLPQSQAMGGYLPSQLMDMHFGNFTAMQGNPNPAMNMPTQGMMLSQQMPGMMNQQNMLPNPPNYSALFGNQPPQRPVGSKPQLNKSKIDADKGNMANWYNLFAELDPLQNPDSLGKKDEKSDKQGSC